MFPLIRVRRGPLGASAFLVATVVCLSAATVRSSSSMTVARNREAPTVRRRLEQFYDYSLASGGTEQMEASAEESDGWSSETSSGEWDGIGASASSFGDSDSLTTEAGPSSTSYGDSSYGDSPASSYEEYNDAYSGESTLGGSPSSYHPASLSWFQDNSDVEVPLIAGVLLSILLWISGMLFTAYQFQSNPEGHFVQCCRLSLHSGHCLCTLLCKLYLCRLNEIPPVVCAADGDEEALTKLRPGLARALDVEHGKTLRKNEIELKLVEPPEEPKAKPPEKPKKKKKKRKKLSYVG